MVTIEKSQLATPCISYGLVRAYLEIPAEFPQAVYRLELSVISPRHNSYT
ncbi:hypothetical protein [Gelidibacter sp.]